MTDLTAQKPHAAFGHGPEALQLQTISKGAMALDVAVIGDEPWFHASSLAIALEYSSESELLRVLSADEKAVFGIHVAVGSSTAKASRRRSRLTDSTFLNVPGFFRAVVNSPSERAEPLKGWVFRDVLPSIRKTGQYKMHEDAKRLGVTFDFTDAQWEWLKLRPWMVDLLVLAAAGYNGVEISRMLNYNTLYGITAVKQIAKLKSLGFLPPKIEPRVKQLERRIKAERAAGQAAPPTP